MKKVLIVVLLLALAAALTACGGKETAVIPELLPAAGVETDRFTVCREDVFVPKMITGSVTPYVEALSTGKDTVLESVCVRSGQLVRKGDKLVSYDLSDVNGRISALEAELAKRAGDNADSDEIASLKIRILANEAEYLREQGASQEEIELKLLDKEQAELDLKHARELREPEIAALEKELAELKELSADDGLYAPFDGRVCSILTVKAGDRVNAKDTVMVLADESRLSIRTEYISDSDWKLADGGAYALIGDSRYEISRVPTDKSEYLSAVLAGRSVNSYFNIEGPADKLQAVRAGDYCALILVTRYYPDQLVIPMNAVMSDAIGKYVYVVDEEGERERRYIKVHTLGTAIYSMVLEGLEEGDVIYVADK